MSEIHSTDPFPSKEQLRQMAAQIAGHLITETQLNALFTKPTQPSAGQPEFDVKKIPTQRIAILAVQIAKDISKIVANDTEVRG